jgi:capsule polysaccharide modification protein KpsS
MARYANYTIERETDKYILLQDQGPWDQYFTITNDIENVVQRLVENGRLKPGQRLFYRDSEGDLTEAIVKDGEFASFAVAHERYLQELDKA